MQTFDELIRQFPSRSQLFSLRNSILSDEPERELDLALHKAFCRFAAEFVEVSTLLTYRVANQQDYTIQKSQWLWSRNDSIGSIDDTGVIHYWESERPGFWDDLMPIPRYTTRVEDALDLKWTLLGSDVHIILEERFVPEDDDDRQQVSRNFVACLLGKDKNCLCSAEHQQASKAIIIAIIDYLLSIEAGTRHAAHEE